MAGFRKLNIDSSIFDQGGSSNLLDMLMPLIAGIVGGKFNPKTGKITGAGERGEIAHNITDAVAGNAPITPVSIPAPDMNVAPVELPVPGAVPAAPIAPVPNSNKQLINFISQKSNGRIKCEQKNGRFT